ncbi:purple acid phosphatase [Perkinsus olseni]|uniref:Purple acid phosphatase n=1 Tax=Perkinsus olseni TaxID=32597 RepID=A0A7J6L1Z6_PEROL|nr:purple acid phosphatase [Perkinsus olseni]KAF4654987.1 purple acid phosphatase [Perkinsus olseni]
MGLHAVHWSLFAVTVLVVGAEGRPRMHFNDNTGELKILVFSDLHYGEGEDKDRRSDTFQRKMLEAEKPDMVVFNGDAYSDYSAPESCKGSEDCTEWFKTQWGRFTSAVRQLQIPYAFTLGNHDHLPAGVKPDGKSVITYDSTHSEWSLSREAPPGVSGGSVYYVPVYENSTAKGRPTGVLWMLDSGKENCMGLKGWGCATQDQIEWFKSQADSDELKGVQGIVFVHIPLQEILLYWNAYGGDPSLVTGLKTEDVCCSSVNTGLFAAAFDHNVSGIFHGHDHNNDFLARVESNSRTIHVGYGRKSGYGGYGGVLADVPGATVIVMKLSEDRQSYSWSSYMRLERTSVMRNVARQIEARRVHSRSDVQGICAGMT